MKIKRREFVAGLPIFLWFANTLGTVTVSGKRRMYGLIGTLIAVNGKRDELIKILLEGTKEMPGCLCYLIAKDTKDSKTIWITEIWKDEKSHKASLSLPGVKKAITKGKPMIEGFGDQIIVEPVGGQGLKV